MSEYKEYVTAVNKIFDYINKMKAGWNSQDNINYIETIEEYKSTVANSVNLFKQNESQPSTPPKEKLPETNTKLEALGND